MATVNPTLIASQVVGSGGAASVTFSSIPNTYTDLLISLSTRNDTSSSNTMYIALNGSTSSFTFKQLFGDGGAAHSGSGSTNEIGVSNSAAYTASTFSNTSIYIPNYTSSNYKSISVDTVVENNATTSYALFYASLWSNTAAVTSVSFTLTSGNFAQYSTAYLYGIKNS